MATISQLTNFSVTLATGLMVALATIATATDPIPIEWILATPIPFFVFAFLILREDFLMVAHDRYFYELRARILSNLGQSPAASMLRFLPSIKSSKIGPWFTILSGMRYAPPLFVLPVSLLWFFRNSEFACALNGFLNVFLLLLNLGGVVLLLVGIWKLGKEHKEIEELVPQEGKPSQAHC